MSVGKHVAAGVHVDLERQRLLGPSDAEPVRGAGSDDDRSASASARTPSREKASTSSASTRIKLAASVVAGVCCVLGVAALGGVGLGARGAVRLAGLGDVLDAGFGRALTPEEQARTTADTSRAAAERSAAALDEAFAFDDAGAGARAVPRLGAFAESEDGDAEDRFEDPSEDPSPLTNALADRLGAAARGADGSPIVSAKTGVVNEPVTLNARHDLSHVAAKLGAWGDCPRAFRKPRVGAKSDWSAAYVQTLSLAEQVYVLCVRCDEFVAPNSLASKTVLIDGRVFDECDQADKYGLDHYKRASLSHAAAVADAMNKKYKAVAVVEEDSTTPRNAGQVFDAPLSDVDAFALKKALAAEDWSFARLGWRQYTLEIAPTSQCPPQCSCLMRGEKLCFVAGSGCDLRSSDSYIISHRYFRWMLDQLIQGGTVDYDVLPRAPGTLLALPILSAQKTLDIPVEHQAAVSELFMNRCLVGDVPDFSREVRAEALAMDELRQFDADAAAVAGTASVFGAGAAEAQREAVERALRPEERARALSYAAEEEPSE
jgi:hypothetical protein